MEDLLHCPLCKSGRFLVFTKVKDHAISKETFTLCHCTKCKLHFTNKRPTASEIAPYYASDNYTSHKDEGAGLKTWLYKKGTRNQPSKKDKAP
ncbi:hypothetical protein [Nitritalea halalkaliphila]|uniref:hypothetical protein n=1 Tax=Nitritalea halalkaliphila TaxID=590849 RepID=UPI001EE6620F|nr:hypothetical protein [Nitritalea halalkaliphila]